MIVPLTFARPTNLAETGRALVTIDATGRMQRVVASLPSATNFACASRWSSGGASGAFSIPFCSYPLVQVSDDGRWVVSILQGHGGSSPSGARLVLLSTSGDTLANVPIDLAQVPMPSRVADSAKAALLNPTVPGVQYTLPPAAIKALKEVVIPPTYPIVKSVLLGSDRSVWVEHWMPGGSLRWSLLDERTGRTVRRIALPGGVQVFAGDAGQLVGVRTDASGVEHVERYIIVQ